MENEPDKKVGKLSFSSIDVTCPLQSETATTDMIADDPMLNGGDMAEVKLGKNPKRILHFCDGTIEEYSSDEDDETDCKSATTTHVTDPKTLTWGPWFWYQTARAGTTSLKVCDYLGESLASFFGITTPKYQYEIEEYKRMLAEEEEVKSQQDLEMGGWTKDSTQSNYEAIQSPPKITQKDAPIPSLPTGHKDCGDAESNPYQRY